MWRFRGLKGRGGGSALCAPRMKGEAEGIGVERSQMDLAYRDERASRLAVGVLYLIPMQWRECSCVRIRCQEWD